MCNPMARGPYVALQTVFCGPQVRWAVGKNAKLHSINRLLKLIVCIVMQIQYLLKCFQSLNLLVQSTTFSFGNCFYIQYKNNVKKKAKGQVGD